MVSDHMQEVIFIGLPGPTHHYGGLSLDNVAATANRGSRSSPRQAALQVLELARLLVSLGLEAAILPPQLRPQVGLLRQHFSGDDDKVIAQAARLAPELLEKASSASAMWVANAATVAPAVDCTDGKLHISTANLFTHLHRRIEAGDTYHALQAIFKGTPQCEVHPPLFSNLHDEGAANHMRLSPSHSDVGLHIFVYGEEGRQTLAASQAIAAQHHLPERQTLFLRQNPDIIRAGVFHNDVIAVSNEQVLLAHEKAYADKEDMARLVEAYRALHPDVPLTTIIITEAELSVEEAVGTYLFNSQIVTKPEGAMAMIAPIEAGSGKAAAVLERIRTDMSNPIDEIVYIDLRQSMRNGGGPACLRLRVPMNVAQLSAVKNSVNVFADDALLAAITKLIETYYPQELSPQDLGDPVLYHQGKAMMVELSEVMRLPLLP